MDSNLRRFFAVFLGTFLISLFSSYASNTLLGLVPVLPAFGLLAGIIAVGVAFDIIGVATTAASEVPYHAMAADKVPGSMQAMWVVRNAATIATLCNDMIGDIVGTLSGAVATGIAISMGSRAGGGAQQAVWVTILVSGSAAMMVGGKALGKDVAIEKANDIVYLVGKFIYVLERVSGLRITSLGNTVGSNRKRAVNRKKKRGTRTKQGV